LKIIIIVCKKYISLKIIWMQYYNKKASVLKKKVKMVKIIQNE